ncbi:hypothetical protein [Desulfosporosinus youngiae]|uniref:hypothetical protein n=1 Tax=Desulfosporosinus youngiae TaxID=339862 RepID=UPI00145DA3B3|nr:hypothetical protein [Desulfosporosinus youngiae]
MHGEAVKAHKPVRGYGATGSQGITRRFGGVPHRRVGQPRNAAVSGCGRNCPTREHSLFNLARM